jgi:hypothetical protein
MAGSVQQLQDDIERMSRDLARERPEAARDLREAARGMREGRLRDKIQFSRGVMRQGAPDYAAQLGAVDHRRPRFTFKLASIVANASASGDQQGTTSSKRSIALRDPGARFVRNRMTGCVTAKTRPA